MDYSKLTAQERISALIYHELSTNNQLPTNWRELLRSIEVKPGDAVAIEIIDLYIADQLHKQGMIIPEELNMDTITPEYYKQLAPLIYLPPVFNNENYQRAKRIVRIIRDLNRQLNKQVPILPSNITTRKIDIMPLVFKGVNQFGDFGWMIKQQKYNDVLFLFNDNESQFALFINSLGTNNIPQGACSPGGGNAVIRPYQCQNPPRAAGIPTGNDLGGYQSLQRSKQFIDAAFFYIEQLLETGRYRSVAYSAASDGSLGTAIFSPSKEVKEYILGKILALSG